MAKLQGTTHTVRAMAWTATHYGPSAFKLYWGLYNSFGVRLDLYNHDALADAMLKSVELTDETGEEHYVAVHKELTGEVAVAPSRRKRRGNRPPRNARPVQQIDDEEPSFESTLAIEDDELLNFIGDDDDE